MYSLQCIVIEKKVVLDFRVVFLVTVIGKDHHPSYRTFWLNRLYLSVYNPWVDVVTGNPLKMNHINYWHWKGFLQKKEAGSWWSFLRSSPVLSLFIQFLRVGSCKYDREILPGEKPLLLGYPICVSDTFSQTGYLGTFVCWTSVGLTTRSIFVFFLAG